MENINSLLVFSTHTFEKSFINAAAEKMNIAVHYLDTQLNKETAYLAKGAKAICLFVNDDGNSETLRILKEQGVELILLRSAGFNNIDLATCRELGIKVARVPEYSPYSVAEHTIALIQCLNRKLHKALPRVRDLNFSLDNLIGFDLHGKTVGVLGTGKIGSQVARILNGFGCEVLAYDEKINEELIQSGICRYTDLEEILIKSHIVSLHLPLNSQTHHLINRDNIKLMKPEALLVNTSRGALLETKALIQALKHKRLRGAALDVYEEEENIFFSDHSFDILQDDQLARLLTFPNVIITAHQAFLTFEALEAIATTTIQNLDQYRSGHPLRNEVLLKE